MKRSSSLSRKRCDCSSTDPEECGILISIWFDVKLYLAFKSQFCDRPRIIIVNSTYHIGIGLLIMVRENWEKSIHRRFLGRVSYS